MAISWDHGVLNDVDVLGPESLGRLLIQSIGSGLQEVMIALAIGSNRLVKSATPVALGVRNSAAASPADVFRASIAEGAAAVVVAHNHPSGFTAPSIADLAVTTRLIRAGILLGIDTLDHIIVSNTSWRSLRESTRLWSPASPCPSCHSA